MPPYTVGRDVCETIDTCSHGVAVGYNIHIIIII